MGRLGRTWKRNLRLNTTLICGICGVSFHSASHNSKYCSYACKYEVIKEKTKAYGKLQSAQKPLRKKKCIICKQIFTFDRSSPSSGITCSDVCSQKRRNRCAVERRKKLSSSELKSLRKYQNAKQKEYFAKLPKIVRCKLCEICNLEFTPAYKSNAKACSEECKKVLNKNRLKKWALNNPEKIAKYQKNHESKRKIAYKKWAKNNRSKLNAFSRAYSKKAYYSTNPDFKLKLLMRNSMFRMIKNHRNSRNLFSIIDYDHKELKEHIENQFKPGMTWENWNHKTWHIDHIKPVNTFNFCHDDGSLNKPEIKKCMALSNLRPLWAKENLNRPRKIQGGF